MMVMIIYENPSDGIVRAVALTRVSVVLIILDNQIRICSDRAR